MPHRRPRRVPRLAWALPLVVIAALPWGARFLLLERARRAGLRWRESSGGVLETRLEAIEWHGLGADELWWSWRHPLEVELHGLELDLSRSGTGSATAAGFPVPVDVVLDQVSLGWKGHVLLDGLSGRAHGGAVELSGPGARLELARGRAVVDAELPLDLGRARGELSLHAEAERGEVSALLRFPRLELRDPLLARDPLPVEGLRVELDGGPKSGRGRAGLGKIQVELSWSCEEGCELSAELPDTPAEDALAPLAPVVPELRKARVEGTIGGRATLSWPSRSWRLEPRIHVSGVEGAVPAPGRLRFGPFEYLGRGGGGEDGGLGPSLQRSGEGSAGWVPLDRISPWLVRAVLAAEDVSFREHGGYDEAALRDALDADLREGRVVRGGSTLTQQLAKNLFLDGRQTIARKVRELLLAVELDRALGKRRVLELYLNVVEWGPGIRGVGPACERYFLKEPARLQPNEAAFLAAILPAPRAFYRDWYLRGRPGSFRVGRVLRNMADAGTISRAEAERWAREPIRFVPPP